MSSKRNTKLAGFLVGFGAVSLGGLILIVAWAIMSNGSPIATLVPSAIPMSAQSTVVPSPSDRIVTPSPSPDNPATATPLPTPTIPSPVPTRSEAIEYTVRAGDTLFGIALAHGIAVETIQVANDLESETIVPGQVLSISPGPFPTPTPYVEGDAIVHTVSSGETLIGIAKRYSVTVETIQTANELNSETILPGWQLHIPLEDANANATVVTPDATTDKEWVPSILRGDLAAGYPLTLESERFTMHYQPDTPAASTPDQVRRLIESAVAHIESELDVSLKDQFDVYVAGSLFAPPDMGLRGRSFSSQRRTFLLYDDSGTPEERRYMFIHELTHLVTWNTVGRPSSVLLHEGAAVYTGIEGLEAAGFVPLDHFCAAYQQAGQLPRISGNRSYQGHINDLDLYFAAGCFVDYLIKEQGIEEFKQLFASGDYEGIYGRDLSQLEADWIMSLEATVDELTFNGDELVRLVTELIAAYDRLFAEFGGTPAQMSAYRTLDQARIAVLQGRFGEAQDQLSDFEELLTGEESSPG